MRRGTDRVLTTHVGSLPRPPALADLILNREEGQAVDESEVARSVTACVRDVVRQQFEIGLDIVSDGELGKPAFVRYVKNRLTGFNGVSSTPTYGDVDDFPAFGNRSRGARRPLPNPACDGPVAVKDGEAVKQDIANLEAALGDHLPEDAFVPCASPGVICMNFDNHHYPSHEQYLQAVADAMRYEYKTLADAGFIVQLDSPDLAMGRHRHFKDRSLEEFRKNSEMSIEALNHAVAGIPSSQLRMHLCWGNYEGPHTRDVELKDILDIVLRANVEGVSIESANPRHEHEWEAFEQLRWPDDKVLIPGVIDTTTNFVEHPRIVAQRIERFVGLLGREHVIAGTDCGFGTIAGDSFLATDVIWAKLAVLVEGARLALQR